MRKILILAVAAIAILTGCNAKYDPNEEFLHTPTGAKVTRSTAVAHNLTDGIIVICELGEGATYMGMMNEADEIRIADPAGFKCTGWKGN